MATIPSMDSFSPVEDRLQLAEGLFDVVERAMSHTRGAGSALVLRRDTEWIVRTSNGIAPEVGAAIVFASGVIGECARNGKPYIGSPEEANLDAVLRPLGIRSVITVPVTLDSKTEGVLAVLHQMPEAFSRMHAAIMMTMSTEVAGLLKRFEAVVKEAPQPKPVVVAPKPVIAEMKPIAPEVAPKPVAAVPPAPKPLETPKPIAAAKAVETPAPKPIVTPKPVEQPAPMKLMIDQPIAAKPAKPAFASAPTAKPTGAPARVPSTLFEVEASREPVKRAAEVLCPGDDPLKYGNIQTVRPRASEIYTAPSPYIAPKTSRPMMMPMIVIAVLAIAGAAFGAWHYTHVPSKTEAQEPPAATTPSPVAAAAPAPESTTPPAAKKAAVPVAAALKEEVKAEAAKPTIDKPVEKKAEVAEAPAAPVTAIHVASGHKADAANVDAPSLNLLGGAALPQLPAPKAAAASLVIRKTSVVPAVALRTVPPVYPDIARRNGTSGEVKLQLSVSPTGKVQGVKVISGPALLRQAATNAVSQWLYKPAMLEGRAVESSVEVTVKFEAK